jgi:hypothetical protein
MAIPHTLETTIAAEVDRMKADIQTIVDIQAIADQAAAEVAEMTAKLAKMDFGLDAYRLPVVLIDATGTRS